MTKEEFATRMQRGETLIGKRDLGADRPDEVRVSGAYSHNKVVYFYIRKGVEDVVGRNATINYFWYLNSNFFE